MAEAMEQTCTACEMSCGRELEREVSPNIVRALDSPAGVVNALWLVVIGLAF